MPKTGEIQGNGNKLPIAASSVPSLPVTQLGLTELV